VALKRQKAVKKPAGRTVQKIVSIPEDVVLAPQAEAPRGLAALERPQREGAIKELSWAEFDRLVQGIAREVKGSFKPEAVVGVVHGGVFVGGAIASALSLEFFPVRISRRSRDKASREGKPRLQGEMPAELRGKRVLVVDDVASSGDTLELARALLAKVKAKAVATACLVCREDGYTPDYLALTTSGLVVFPWDYELELPPGYGR
jgi:hypoxanthine phosphoribosyltransferase